MRPFIKKLFTLLSVLLLLSGSHIPATSQSQSYPLITDHGSLITDPLPLIPDPRFAPKHSYTLISLPDDWQKTMLTESGALAYDFGPGPYARPITTVSFAIKGSRAQSKYSNILQTLDDPNIPILRTELRDSLNRVLSLRSFARVEPGYTSPNLSDQIQQGVLRHNGLTGVQAWIRPDSTWDPAFASAAWGTNRAIRYQAQVEPGSHKRVALGFLEGWKGSAKARLMELRVEGAANLIVDPLAEGLRGKPYVFLMDAVDLNGDGQLAIEVHPTPSSPDPNVFLSVFWVFEAGFRADPLEIATGKHNKQASLYVNCGFDALKVAPEARYDVIRAQLNDPSASLIVRVQTYRSLRLDADRKRILADGQPFILLQHPIVSIHQEGFTWEFELAEGVRETALWAVHGTLDQTSGFPEVQLAEAQALAYWKEQTTIPRGALMVPDPRLQYLVDTSIRNIYQARERVDGRLQFQPGPSVYRGLWIGDLILTGYAALYASDTTAMRLYLEAALPFQNEEGHVRVMVPNLSLYENPIFISSMVRYALAADNKAWMVARWEAFRKAVDWIRFTRDKTLTDPKALNYGLFPNGFIDGGISTPGADYGSVWWAITALEDAVALARWLGKVPEATAWESLRLEMITAAEKAANRDLQTHTNGLEFLPVLVGDRQPKVPQLGQFSYVWPTRYSAFLQTTQGIMASVRASNLRFLESTVQQGLISGVGWLNDGLWFWLSGIHGSLQLVNGEPEKAVQTAYALAEHANGAGVWVEEQWPAHLGDRTTGDVSNAESSAAFYMLIRDLIAYEAGPTLQLLAGVPSEWIQPNARIALKNSFTRFGPLSLSLQVSSDGSEITFEAEAVDGRGHTGSLVVNDRVLRSAGYERVDSVIPNQSPIMDQRLNDQPTIPFGQSFRLVYRRSP